MVVRGHTLRNTPGADQTTQTQPRTDIPGADQTTQTQPSTDTPGADQTTRARIVRV
jgi:hypothetical protein